MEHGIVKVRGLVLGDGIPKICIPLTARTEEELEEQLNQALEGPCDLAEWRVDYYEKVENRDALLRAMRLLRSRLGERPLLFTFRTAQEGGEREISPDEYVSLNEFAAISGIVDLIDVELNRGREKMQALIRSIQECGCRAVCSFHDFSRTPEPEELLRILCSMQAIGADVTKAAVMPHTEEDVLKLLDVSVQMKTRFADRPFITMAMGRLGAISRLAGAFDGSAVTFATSGRASAPGQIDARALAGVLSLL